MVCGLALNCRFGKRLQMLVVMILSRLQIYRVLVLMLHDRSLFLTWFQHMKNSLVCSSDAITIFMATKVYRKNQLFKSCLNSSFVKYMTRTIQQMGGCVFLLVMKKDAPR